MCRCASACRFCAYHLATFVFFRQVRCCAAGAAGGDVMVRLMRPPGVVQAASHGTYIKVVMCCCAGVICAGGAVMACLMWPPDAVEAVSHTAAAGQQLWQSWLGPNELCNKVWCRVIAP